MSNNQCRVSSDLLKWQSGQWDCECDESKPEVKCNGCFYNDPDYFDEHDSYEDE